MTDIPTAGLWWTSCDELDGIETWHWTCAHVGRCACPGTDKEMPACGEEHGWSGDHHPTAELGPGDRFCEACVGLARGFVSEHARKRLRAGTQSMEDVWPTKTRELAGTPDGPRSETFAIARAIRVDWQRSVAGQFFIAFYDPESGDLVGSVLPRDDVLAGTDYLYSMPGRVFVHPVCPSAWRLTITTVEGDPAELPFEAAGFGLASTAPFTIDGLAIIETTGAIREIHLVDPVGVGSFEHLVPTIAGGPIPVFGDGGPYALMVTGEGDWTVRVRPAEAPLRLAHA